MGPSPHASHSWATQTERNNKLDVFEFPTIYTNRSWCQMMDTQCRAENLENPWDYQYEQQMKSSLNTTCPAWASVLFSRNIHYHAPAASMLGSAHPVCTQVTFSQTAVLSCLSKLIRFFLHFFDRCRYSSQEAQLLVFQELEIAVGEVKKQAHLENVHPDLQKLGMWMAWPEHLLDNMWP